MFDNLPKSSVFCFGMACGTLLMTIVDMVIQ